MHPVGKKYRIFRTVIGRIKGKPVLFAHWSRDRFTYRHEQVPFQPTHRPPTRFIAAIPSCKTGSRSPDLQASVPSAREPLAGRWRSDLRPLMRGRHTVGPHLRSGRRLDNLGSALEESRRLSRGLKNVRGRIAPRQRGAQLHSHERAGRIAGGSRVVLCLQFAHHVEV